MYVQLNQSTGQVRSKCIICTCEIKKKREKKREKLMGNGDRCVKNDKKYLVQNVTTYWCGAINKNNKQIIGNK